MLASVEQSWWEPRQVPLQHALCCRLGALHFTLEHLPGEWRLVSRHGDEDAADGSAAVTLRALEEGNGEDRERFMVAAADDRVRLLPLLADRPVVIRPRQPVFLPPGEAITLYVSTPVTVALQVGEAQRLLRELVTVPLSDTWFGPDTRTGELCYSGRTSARHHRADLPLRAHRAVTPVRICNEADQPLPLTKFSLPVPVLSLFGDADGSLWTQSVSLVRSSASDLAELEVEDVPTDFAGPKQPLSGPRQPRPSVALVRAFSGLFT